MVQIADWMERVAQARVTTGGALYGKDKDGSEYRFDESALRRIRQEVRDVCTSERFPVPGIEI